MSEPTNRMREWQSVKRVLAGEITAVHAAGCYVMNDDKTVVFRAFEPAMTARYQPQVGDFWVVYGDGYQSISPSSAFVDGYVSASVCGEAEQPERRRHQTIGWAVEQMHNGRLVRRAGWNGKGMFLFLIPGSHFRVSRAPLLGIYPEGTEIDYHAHVDMKTAQGYVVPWLCSQADLLACDWEIAE